MHIDGKQVHRVKINGKLSFSSLPSDVQKAIRQRLSDKDPSFRGNFEKGILPGIKIDGKVVTKDNIKDFEIDSMKPEVVKKESVPEEEKVEEVKESTKYTEEELKSFGFSKLRRIAKKFGETGRSSFGLIKEILRLQ